MSITVTRDWLNRRHRTLHMTIRDIDCATFDVAQTIELFQRWKVSLFSFFAGGYITTYPTNLPWQRMAPGLNGRDLCGEIIDAARKAGIITFPMIDLGEIPLEVAERNPDWVGRKADGSFYMKTDGIATACPLGGYIRECSIELLRELTGRYEIDGIKWGGASYGGVPGVCHCEHCRQRFAQDTGGSLPDKRSPEYEEWRYGILRETVRYLAEAVHQCAPIPVMGNLVWRLGRGQEVDDLCRSQDFVQVEVQTRTWNIQDDDSPASWDRFSTPIETTRYVSNLTRRPPWVVASTFLAWPWRRVAVPHAEQKLYLAQIAANGGSPMANLTTGSPLQHPDPRSFSAIEELYNFMADHAGVYDGDVSAARVAIVYDADSAALARRQNRLERGFLIEIQGAEDALDRAHIPYDLIPSAGLATADSRRYACLVLPAAEALSDEACAAVERLAACGVGVVALGAPATRDAAGSLRPSPLLALLGAGTIGDPQPFLRSSPHLGPSQAYLKHDGRHPIVAGIECPLIAVAGYWHPVTPKAGMAIPVRRGAAFRLFPEGLSRADQPDPDEPMALVRDEPTVRTVYYPFQWGYALSRVSHPDNDLLLTNAVQWAARDDVAAQLKGLSDVRLSLRATPGRLHCHLVNTTGRRRYLTEFAPVSDFTVRLACAKPPRAVRQASSGAALPFDWSSGWAAIHVPRLVDYDVLSLELA